MVLGIAGWALYPIYLIHSYRWENEGDYARRRERYEALIASLAKLPVPGSRMAFFYVDADRTPSSLRPLKAEELIKERFDFIKTGCCLQVGWPDDGSIVAVFYNKDLGPFGGLFGTIHSPVIPSAAQLGFRGVFKQVAPNWWAGHFD